MASQRLSDRLPPLIFGTATFNYQFNPDPYALGPTQIVQKALAQGVRAFDTSPYYGPAESILGDAFDTPLVQDNYPRDQYMILTKAGRIAADTFDYSAEWVRQSVKRSCSRFRTNYLDVVYCHDVEFVTPAEVLTAVRELRRIRDEEGTLNYVGICGYPVEVLCDLAEMILRETGEPLDIVQSYANFTVQNTRLLSQGLARLVNAGVDVVTNASPLGMGLLRKQGVPIGAMGDFHPAPDALREACSAASRWTEAQGEKLEVVAVRFALENWLRDGAKVGGRGDPLGVEASSYSGTGLERQRLGVNVMGVSKIEELDETMRVWRSVLDGLSDDFESEPGTLTPSDGLSDHEWSLQRRQQIRNFAKSIRKMLGSWADFAWDSPDADFVNKARGISHADAAGRDDELSAPALVLTPPPESENQEILSKPVDVSSFSTHWSPNGSIT